MTGGRKYLVRTDASILLSSEKRKGQKFLGFFQLFLQPNLPKATMLDGYLTSGNGQPKVLFDGKFSKC